MFRSARKRGAVRVKGSGALENTCGAAGMRGADSGQIQLLFLRFCPYALFFTCMIVAFGGLQPPPAEAGQFDMTQAGKTAHMSDVSCVRSQARAVAYGNGLENSRKHPIKSAKKACGEEKCRCCIDGFCSCMKKTQCDTSGGACKAGKPKEDGTKSGWYRHVPFTPRSSAIRSYAACTMGG